MALGFSGRQPRTWSDARTERTLGACAVVCLLFVVALAGYVFVNAWPSFSHNGLAWFGSGGNVDQQLHDIQLSPSDPAHFQYHLRAWPLLYGTILTTVLAVGCALVVSLFASIFLTEFAPVRMQKILDPVVRLLAAVPSIVFGLIGILVIVPWVRDHVIGQHTRDSLAYVVQLTGQSVAVAVFLLTVMISPIMIAIITDALRAVPRSWTEGSASLGVNRWQTMWRISVRAVRPAIIAAVVLSTARALGEAIMLSLVAGSAQSFSPNPLDGVYFFLEPVHPLAATIVDNAEALSATPLKQTIYAFAALLLLSSAVLSIGGTFARRSMRRYGIQS
jgi:phosphate ABC transporter permease protein PstC